MLARLAPYRANLQLDLLLCSRPIAAKREGGRIRLVALRNERSGEHTVLHAPFFMPAFPARRHWNHACQSSCRTAL
jgi:hypothetical protein